jgi:hypothetical protein
VNENGNKVMEWRPISLRYTGFWCASYIRFGCFWTILWCTPC